ncbi:16S rRNA (cytosine(1402)-N(4))-methyltransferase RsmH [Mycobacterium crocinum]|uniref:Ribosomal RNA small subunit methyltransferase H n=1 Tax=Mycolicibacterium crocinum TaxID=388459 RepID=A0ABY3TE83_9MYCO|nr:16S rRNA (cytosine(1402)-N(4))-methyltransferase RsmH [Mycolicibacterium crocinum]MCV7214259.1 16S rRNA (cytosine(1402)-N(4))-methyltransferase RsmH [Mycolicibacterium crocinum]ULN39773.1 16S rRNA (cytosine(1402)-N(4))-methyltransferase RsmH [Mycolicibacterium crocinum]
MKHSATSSELAAQPEVARASWSLPEPTLTYFPNARFALSDRDLDAGAHPDSPGGPVVVDESDHGHIPVLLDRCVEILGPALTRPGAVLVDATLGAGGHSERFLTEFGELRLIGLDRDPGALAGARARLAPFADRVTLVHTRYDGIADALVEAGCGTTESIDGVLFDLGVSSMQLDQAERGFSYAKDAPLDMRMDTDAPLTAAEILNTYDRAELTDILRRFGEEKFAHRIAGLIVERRQEAPLATTGELVEIVYKGIPAPARRTGGHPAKRTFQALRIAVNAELDSLTAALPAALAALRVGGRIAVMSYQSLEDRIVKTTFAAATASRSPEGLPVELPGYEPEFSAITRGAERAGAEEIERNPRSAPVRLRALQRVMSVNPGRGGKN